MVETPISEPVLCSNCFRDVGLRVDAATVGFVDQSICPNCQSPSGAKLDKELVRLLADRFFVRGSIHRPEYGGFPFVIFNERDHEQKERLRGYIDVADWLKADVELIEKVAGIGFFYYGPRAWMMGDVEPLRALQDENTRTAIIERILAEYPTRLLDRGDPIYRLRVNPKTPEVAAEYDSPPDRYLGTNRLDKPASPVLYASQALEICVHECRVAVEDELFIATLSPERKLKLLNLAMVLKESVTEFDSLDMAIHMLFLAGKHSYPITRQIAAAAQAAGFDGIIYPSYYSLIRLGVRPFETVYGITVRRLNTAYAQTQTIENLAVFGRPIAAGLLKISCIDRLILNRIRYHLQFGPVGLKPYG